MVSHDRQDGPETRLQTSDLVDPRDRIGRGDGTHDGHVCDGVDVAGLIQLRRVTGGFLDFELSGDTVDLDDQHRRQHDGA